MKTCFSYCLQPKKHVLSKRYYPCYFHKVRRVNSLDKSHLTLCALSPFSQNSYKSSGKKQVFHNTDAFFTTLLLVRASGERGENVAPRYSVWKIFNILSDISAIFNVFPIWWANCEGKSLHTLANTQGGRAWLPFEHNPQIMNFDSVCFLNWLISQIFYDTSKINLYWVYWEYSLLFVAQV